MRNLIIGANLLGLIWNSYNVLAGTNGAAIFLVCAGFHLYAVVFTYEAYKREEELGED